VVKQRQGAAAIGLDCAPARDGDLDSQRLCEIELWAAPSPQWRAAFLRPPPSLITANRTPEVGRVAIHGATLHFRAAPRHLTAWLRRIDRWIGYANSLVEE